MNKPRLASLITPLDFVSEWLGRGVAWLALAMALLTCFIVIGRKFFNWGSIAAQESVIYMHAALFLLAAAYTLKHDAHVRVDIFYGRFSAHTKAWVNSVGIVTLLLPFAFFLLFMSWPYMQTSWRIREVSADPGGIPAVFLLKSLMPIAAGTLILQGVAELLRHILILTQPTQNDATAAESH